jgi:hypothetical protein
VGVWGGGGFWVAVGFWARFLGLWSVWSVFIALGFSFAVSMMFSDDLLMSSSIRPLCSSYKNHSH